ncbi:MAG: right-handed parallel beta-helix repeat-containing protein, partial [Methanobacteriota archaeon]
MSSFPVFSYVFLLLFVCLYLGIIPVYASISVDDSPNTTIYDGNMVISSPGILSKPGIYIVQADISLTNTTTALEIVSNDVIIEGAGHTLSGSGISDPVSYGIRVKKGGSRLQNISIRNLTTTGFETGIFLDDVIHGGIEGCTILHNLQTGIKIINGSDISIIGTEISSTIPDFEKSGGTGIQISDSDSVTIRSDIILDNGRGDDGSGLSIIRSPGITIDETTITGSAASGVITQGPNPGLIIQKNIISSNNVNGVTIGAGCIGPQISGNQIRENYLTGIEITSSNQGFISGNTIEWSRIGVSLSESEEFSLTDNEIKGNTLNFDVTGSSPVQYTHFVDISNRADGRSIWYLTNISHVTIGPSENPSCIYAVNCSGITISDIIFSKGGTGIFLINSEDVSISRIAALNNAFGIRIGYGSRSITVSESNAEKNLIAGFAVS